MFDMEPYLTGSGSSEASTLQAGDILELQEVRRVEEVDVFVARMMKRRKDVLFYGPSLLDHLLTLKHRVNRLEARAERAESHGSRKADYTAGLVHDIRGLAHVVVTYCDYLRPIAERVSQGGLYLKQIEKSAAGITRLLEDLGRAVTETDPELELNLNEISLIDEVLLYCRSFAEVAESKGVKFEVKWLTPVPRTVSTDTVRFNQVLSNLLGNAVKFTEKGSVTVELAFSSGLLDVTVKDTGIGMSREEQARLFEPHFHGKPGYAGSGLGLTVARQVARFLGGDVVLVRSKPGGGSTLRATLPLAVPANAQMVENPETYVAGRAES